VADAKAGSMLNAVMHHGARSRIGSRVIVGGGPVAATRCEEAECALVDASPQCNHRFERSSLRESHRLQFLRIRGRTGISADHAELG
jgi:hypothetical protein